MLSLQFSILVKKICFISDYQKFFKNIFNRIKIVNYLCRIIASGVTLGLWGKIGSYKNAEL